MSERIEYNHSLTDDLVSVGVGKKNGNPVKPRKSHVLKPSQVINDFSNTQHEAISRTTTCIAQ
jgi:hypothetical protein